MLKWNQFEARHVLNLYWLIGTLMTNWNYVSWNMNWLSNSLCSTVVNSWQLRIKDAWCTEKVIQLEPASGNSVFDYWKVQTIEDSSENGKCVRGKIYSSQGLKMIVVDWLSKFREVIEENADLLHPCQAHKVVTKRKVANTDYGIRANSRRIM